MDSMLCKWFQKQVMPTEKFYQLFQARINRAVNRDGHILFSVTTGGIF